MQTAILRVSDAVSRREAPDLAGPQMAQLVEAGGGTVVAMEVLPDDFALIEDRLHHFADAGCALVLTIGGIGPGRAEITTEATRAVLERDAPAIAEAVRATGRAVDPERALLWRGTAGWVGATLIVNLPDRHVDTIFGVVSDLLDG